MAFAPRVGAWHPGTGVITGGSLRPTSILLIRPLTGAFPRFAFLRSCTPAATIPADQMPSRIRRSFLKVDALCSFLDVIQVELVIVLEVGAIAHRGYREELSAATLLPTG